MVNMSELQVSLIAIGVVVVMGVIFFNWFQQRRYRRHAEQAYKKKHEDVLLRTAMPQEEEQDRATAWKGRDIARVCDGAKIG
jgi:hypothetical protein